MLTKYLWVFFVSMVPLVELRGSIIISQGLQCRYFLLILWQLSEICCRCR